MPFYIGSLAYLKRYNSDSIYGVGAAMFTPLDVMGVSMHYLMLIQEFVLPINPCIAISLESTVDTNATSIINITSTYLRQIA
jgi:hypothetical protein